MPARLRRWRLASEISRERRHLRAKESAGEGEVAALTASATTRSKRREAGMHLAAVGATAGLPDHQPLRDRERVLPDQEARAGDPREQSAFILIRKA